MKKFDGKRALVTGAGSGIGRGIALKLAQIGAEVYGISRSKETLESLEKEHPGIKTIQLDITNWTKTREVVENIAPIHLLVNNAGRGSLSPALEATPEDFDLIYNLNVKSVINITQAVCKGLIARKERGTVVNISSQAGQRPLPGHLLYSSSKAAVEMVTKTFAQEMAPFNIRVNAVSPTVVMTQMGKYAWSDPIKAKKMLDRIPQGRFAEVEEVVNAVIYLLSEDSEMVNGHALPIDGGFLAC